MRRITLYSVLTIFLLGLSAVVLHSLTAKTNNQSGISPQLKVYVQTKNRNDQPKPGQYRQHCFQQQKKGPDADLDFYISGTQGDVQPSYVQLDLYDLEDPDNVTLMDTERQTFKQDKDKITISDARTPPHLGPGPYMAVISSTPVSGAASPSPKHTGYYYETWKKSTKECLHYTGN